MAIALEVIAGSGSFEVISTTAAQTGKEYNSLVVMSDCVFTAFEIGGVNVLSTKGLSGVTIKAGTFLPAGVIGKITAFTLSSGAVVAYS